MYVKNCFFLMEAQPDSNDKRELHLQIKLLELQDLLKQTQHEPRLKGPFPIKLYRSILASLQTILDKLHSMRCVTTREEWYVNLCLEHARVGPNMTRMDPDPVFIGTR
jgi:hypothetical protein